MTAAEIAKSLSCGKSGCGCGKEISPGTWRTHCPLRGNHENNDRTPSFDVTDKGDKILVNCKGGCSQADVIAALKERNLWPSQNGSDRPQAQTTGGGLTLADFGAAKKLDPVFLAKHGVTQANPKNKAPYVVFNYRDITGQKIKEATRMRYAMVDRPIARKKGKPMVYGLQALPKLRELSKEIILFEGESDLLTAWYHKIPALALPGKTMFKTIDPAHFGGFATVYAWQEPGAEDFPAGIAAMLKSVPGLTVKALIPPDGIKDISEAHCQGVNVPELINRLKAEAKTVTPSQGKQGAKKQIEERPLTIDDLQDSQRLHPVIDFRPQGMILGFRVPLPKTKDGPEEGIMTVASDGQTMETAINKKQVFIGDDVFDLGKGSPPYLSDVWSLNRLRDFINYPHKPNPQALFSQIKDSLRTYLDLPEEIYGLLAAWGAGTYFSCLFAAYPFLHFFGPKECGKSKSLEALRFFCFNAFKGRDITAAALGDTVDGQRGTVLIDQAEKLGQTRQPGELNLVGLLADSYKKAGGKRRVVDTSKGRKVMEFSTYGPKAFASTKPLDPDLADRCVKIAMTRTRRRLPDLEGWEPVWADIRDCLYRFALTFFREIHLAYTMTQGNGTRLAELWRPIGAMLAVMQTDPQEEQAIKALFFEQANENRAEPSSWEITLFDVLMEAATGQTEDFTRTSEEILEAMGIDGDHRPGPKWLGETLSKYNLYSYKKRHDGKTDDGKRKVLMKFTFSTDRVNKYHATYINPPKMVCGVCGDEDNNNDINKM